MAKVKWSAMYLYIFHLPFFRLTFDGTVAPGGIEFMIIKKTISLLALLLLIVSCETTKIIYDAKSPGELNSLGITNLNKISPKIDSVFPKLDSNFNAASIKYSNRFLVKESVHLNETLSYANPDSNKIKQLCLEKKLDGIIVTYVDFKMVFTSFYFIPTGKFVECILYTKIYDKNGSLLYTVTHDSKDDAYDKIPTTYDVVNLSAGHTYKKIKSVRQAK